MKKTITFEVAMARLEELTSLLNTGNLPLDEALKLFTESSELIEFCSKQLDNAKLKIEALHPIKKEVSADE